MIATVGAIFLTTILIATALAAVNGDLQLTRNDLEHKRAFAAAQAGIADYAFHLSKDTNYWTHCTNVPNPNAVNQQGTTTKRRAVGGSPDAEYSIELIPATGKSSCDVNNPVTSMLELSGPSTGTFRIRSTGYTDDVKRSLVATFKRTSFLDYVYFTQLETSDPVTYGNTTTINNAYLQCTKTVQQGRNDAPIPNSGGTFCDKIYFKDGDEINGPLHTNDALAICGHPKFGRTISDAIEVSSPPQGWYGNGGCGGDSPNFVGTYFTNAAVLTPPPTNGQLATVAQSDGAVYTNQLHICLNGTSMTYGPTTCSNGPVSLPTNGVIYVKNGSGCSSSYSPFTVTYPTSSGCGNVYVHGTYSGLLTIAAENDIIVDDDLIRTGSGLLGLIANNFVRVYHPFSAETGKGNCNGGSNGAGSQTNLRIDAAILAINHSFIVDHYDCGATLGTLTINGAISQKFRGPVGTFGSNDTGYLKDYEYDDRLRYQEPPYFLDPVQSAWHVQRETLDFP
jgi:hypothetical protein